jgi:hypothetical protein
LIIETRVSLVRTAALAVPQTMQAIIARMRTLFFTAATSLEKGLERRTTAGYARARFARQTCARKIFFAKRSGRI